MFTTIAVFVAAISFQGCVSTPEIELPPEAYYTKAASDIYSPAYLVGWNRKDKYKMFDDHTSYPVIIDGKVIKGDRKSWATQIPIESGPHRVTAMFEMGVYRATAEIAFIAEPGKTYEIVNRDEKRVSWVEFWVRERDTEKIVSDVVRVQSTGGSGGYMPIFIPTG